MNKMVLQLPAYIRSYNRKKDNSITLNIGTTIEVDSDCVRDIDTFRNKEGWFLFSENEIQDSDIPKDNAPTEGKSQSKRLYDVLYVLWHHLKDSGEKIADFNTFYNATTERIIEHYKNKLPERSD